MKCRPGIDAGKRSAGPYRLAIVAWAADVLFRVMGDRTRIIAVGAKQARIRRLATG